MKRAIVGGVLVVMFLASDAAAQNTRPRFEPTDLGLHEGGAAEIDLQFGPLKGDNYVRAFAPDFEISLGFASHAQLEIDGTFGLTDFDSPEFLDNTLVALRSASSTCRIAWGQRARGRVASRWDRVFPRDRARAASVWKRWRSSGGLRVGCMCSGKVVS